MVEIAIDIKKLRDLPTRLKVVGGIILFDLAFLLLGYLLLDDIMAQRVAAVEQARGQLAEARRQNSELRRQLDEYPLMRERYDQAIAGGFATGLDRLSLVQYAQSQGAARHLSDLHFRVAEEPGEHERSTKYRLEIDRIAFESGGLLDTDTVAFWTSVLGQAQGHYRIVEASLERTLEVNSSVLAQIRHGNPVSLMKAKIDFQWIGAPPLDKEAK